VLAEREPDGARHRLKDMNRRHLLTLALGTGVVLAACRIGSAPPARQPPPTRAPGAWRPISAAGAPLPGGEYAAVWTGREMLVWGWAGGGLHEPRADRWRSAAAGGPPRPAGTAPPAVAWTGRELLVWNGMAAAGARYDPAADRWAPMATQDAPSPRLVPTLVWTGAEAVLIGGTDVGGPGRSWIPDRDAGCRPRWHATCGATAASHARRAPMPTAQTDSLTRTLIEGLNQDLAGELGAIVQYLTYAAKASGPFRPQLSDFFLKEIADEQGHAQFLANKIVALGGEPITEPRAVPKARTNRDMLRAVLDAERQAIRDYTERLEQAEKVGEIALRVQLENQIVDETGHAEETERMLKDWPA
jgi:bacterioferritin